MNNVYEQKKTQELIELSNRPFYRIPRIKNAKFSG